MSTMPRMSSDCQLVAFIKGWAGEVSCLNGRVPVGTTGKPTSRGCGTVGETSAVHARPALLTRCLTAKIARLPYELCSAVTEAPAAAGGVAGILQGGQPARQWRQPLEPVVAQQRSHVERL